MGEYGDQTWRPHYHAALYGVSALEDKVVRDSWGLGHVYLGELNQKSSQYIAGYVNKKMTKHDDPRLGDRYPEFARMSLKPGIGANAMDEVAKAIKSNNYAMTLEDVPPMLRHGLSKLPLGRYLRRTLRDKIGRSKDTPPEVLQNLVKELHELRQTDLSTPKIKALPDSFKDAKSIYSLTHKQKILNAEARSNLYASKKGIL